MHTVKFYRVALLSKLFNYIMWVYYMIQLVFFTRCNLHFGVISYCFRVGWKLYELRFGVFGVISFDFQGFSRVLGGILYVSNSDKNNR